MTSNNSPLRKANAVKNDEFYTQLSDIENELKHYQKYFRGKTVLCNCDDPRISNFFHYFSYNFEKLKLKKLITTCYKSQKVYMLSQNDSEHAIYLEYEGDKNNNKVPDPDEIGIFHLEQDGDFRSEECVEILKKSDIVVTNPPFSLFREYIAQLMKYKKKFLIVGNQNAISYVEIFKLLHANKIWLGASIHSGDREFGVPDNYPLNASGFRVDENGRKFIRVKGVRWFTNIDYKERYKDLILFKKSISKAKNILLYLDPPYLINQKLYGDRGNLHNGFDHEGLAEILHRRNNWILSYNDCDEIHDLYDDFSFYHPEWKYRKNVDVYRYKCKCGKLFNFYIGLKKSWTIPKSSR